MHIHLVTYATRRFRHRQLILGWSARLNRVADTVTNWTPELLCKVGFEDRCKDINLSERGSGFWAWKPFIIDAKLREVQDGDLVLYCDVGRLYPFKLLDQPLAPYVRWMNEHGQDVMPGIEIPWDGPNSAWTKREALVATGMDRPEVHSANPIQASFSLWRASDTSRSLLSQWLDLCASRPLISDDPSRRELQELPDFRAHRHDQALLTLCCMRDGIVPLHIGNDRPDFDCRNPSEVSRHQFGDTPCTPTGLGRLLRAAVRLIANIEQSLRKRVKFGSPLAE